MVRKEGNRGLQKIMRSLCIKTFSRKDWIYAVSGLFLAFISTGLIFFISFLLNRYWGLGELKTTPWFMEIKPFMGVEKLLLLLWLPMFFLNITGEELLWRGYIQARLSHKNSWILCSLLWILFHLPFGSGVIIMALPVLVLIPYIFSKTHNTLIAVFIHGIYNGPIFVLIALGIMK
jgi:membrane protease YdiL (CAAX protease family)